MADAQAEKGPTLVRALAEHIGRDALAYTDEHVARMTAIDPEWLPYTPQHLHAAREAIRFLGSPCEHCGQGPIQHAPENLTCVRAGFYGNRFEAADDRPTQPGEAG